MSQINKCRRGTTGWLETILIKNLVSRYRSKNVILTINLSTMRDNIGVTDIGRRSLTSLTGVHLGTGVITAVRHADGTTPEPITSTIKDL